MTSGAQIFLRRVYFLCVCVCAAACPCLCHHVCYDLKEPLAHTRSQMGNGEKSAGWTEVNRIKKFGELKKKTAHEEVKENIDQLVHRLNLSAMLIIALTSG